MADVELEIIDLSTGESVGKFPLMLCTPITYEVDIGSYRFIATYLETGQALQADINIVEGVNAPLDFTFAPLPPTPEGFPIGWLLVPIIIGGIALGYLWYKKK
jgi:hypothetical protein